MLKYEWLFAKTFFLGTPYGFLNTGKNYFSQPERVQKQDLSWTYIGHPMEYIQIPEISDSSGETAYKFSQVISNKEHEILVQMDFQKVILIVCSMQLFKIIRYAHFMNWWLLSKYFHLSIFVLRFVIRDG